MGVSAPGIAAFDGQRWRSIGYQAAWGGPNALATHEGSLMVGGAGVRGWRCAHCYANCDQSPAPSALNVNDFVCFQSRYAAGDPYADCDQTGALNVNDFVCFQSAFAAGCP